MYTVIKLSNGDITMIYLRSIQWNRFSWRRYNELMQSCLRLRDRELRDGIIDLIQSGTRSYLWYARNAPRSRTIRFLSRTHYNFWCTAIQYRTVLIDGRFIKVLDYFLRHRLRLCSAESSAFKATIGRDTTLQILRRDRLPLPIGFLCRIFPTRVTAV